MFKNNQELEIVKDEEYELLSNWERMAMDRQRLQDRMWRNAAEVRVSPQKEMIFKESFKEPLKETSPQYAEVGEPDLSLIVGKITLWDRLLLKLL
jgi:hypothetical protein